MLCLRSTCKLLGVSVYYTGINIDDKQNLKDVLYAAMVLTPEGVTYDSPNVPMTSTPVKKPSAGKLLCSFTNILNV